MASPQTSISSIFNRNRKAPIQSNTPPSFNNTIKGLNLSPNLPGFNDITPILSKAENAVVITKTERDEILTETANREAALPLLTIVRSAISLYSYQDMLKIAGPIKVTNTNLQGNGSVNDPRMGVVSLNESCRYCGQIDCPGHYGLIEYRIPIYNPIVIREIVSILTCVCNDCGGLLITEDVMKTKGFDKLPYDKRLSAMEAYCAQDLLCLRQKPAIGGGAIVPCSRNPTFLTTEIKEKGEITYRFPQQGTKRTTNDDPTHIMPIESVINILEMISDSDAHLLGFARSPACKSSKRNCPELQSGDCGDKCDHPRNMIMRGILVPPVIARPPVYEGGAVHHDQLTHMFIAIQRKVIDISNGKAGRVDLYTMVKQLIFKTEGKKMGMKDFLSIIERIQGKQALLRGLLMGKRVNWCGRTVAGPDPSLEFGQIRIPSIWAPVLTKKIKVTQFNIHNLTALLMDGKIRHITAKKTGLRKFYDPRFKYTLHIGDIVERWLQNGDRIVANRQPTLHRQSMMAYEVVLGYQYTIGLHLSYTSPMNCDFDGDENNVWNPQDFEVEAEADILMNVINNVMSSEQNKPIMGLVMNSISGAYLLTKPDTIKPNTEINGKPVAKLLTRATSIDLLQNILRKFQNFDSFDQSTKYAYFMELKLNLSKVIRRKQINNENIDPNTEIDPNLINENLNLANEVISETEKSGETLKLIYDTLNREDKIVPGTRINDDLFAELLTLITDQTPLATLYQRLTKYGVHPRSGAAIFSAMLPEDFYYNQKGVLIIEGVLVSGQLKKSHVGSSHRSIIQELWKNYGPQRTADFFTDAPWVINKWLIERGFSVGILDCVNYATDENGQEYDKNKRILKEELAIIYPQLEALGGKLDDPVEEKFRQRQINNLVNMANGIGLRLAKDALSGNNSIGVMTDQGAGTKGGIANIGQMFGAVSQQYYHGERLKPTITGKTRLLPSYDENDNNPVANAFIPVSFFTGLSPEGLFFLQAGGREGLLDTALKTAETGSMSHRMIKAFENIIIGYDGSIRNTIGTLFAPMYNSGYDIAEMAAVEYKGKTDFSSFIDLKSVVSELNVERGWIPRNLNDNIVSQRQNVISQISPNSSTESYINGSPRIVNTNPISIGIDIKEPVVRSGPIIKLTKFERARIIGTRATQLSNNAPPLINIETETDPVKIATSEYYAGVLQLYVIRKFADGSYQIVRPTLDNI